MPRIIRMAFVLVGLLDLHDLETAGQRRILLDVLLVFGPGRGGDRAQRAARQRRLQQVGRIARARRAAGADQRVRFVDEQDDRLRRGLDLVDHLAQPLLELALHAGARLQQADIERPQRRHPSAAAARRRPRCAARTPRPPRSCRRPPRRSGSDCSAAAASGCRRSGGSPRRGRRSDRSRPCRARSVRSTENRRSASCLPSGRGAIARRSPRRARRRPSRRSAASAASGRARDDPRRNPRSGPRP